MGTVVGTEGAPHLASGADVGDDEWDALVTPGQAVLRRAYFRAWQRVELPSLHCEPLVVRRGGALVAATNLCSYDMDLAEGADARLARLLTPLRAVWPRALVAAVVEIGSPTPIVNPFLCSGEPDDDDLAPLVAAAVERAHERRADMMIVQNFERDGQRRVLGRVLARQGFSEIPIEPTVVLPLPFDTFEDYVAAMRAQYRRRLRKVFDRSAHLEPEAIDDFGNLVPELTRLWRLVWLRATELKREVLTDAFFAGLADLEYVKVLSLRRPDGSIAAYALLVEDRPWLHFLYTGFEREAGEREGAYFRLLYEIARYAIDGGFATVNFGMTTLAPKLDAGGVVLPLSAWIRHRNRLLHTACVRLARARYASPANDARAVFKG